MKGFWWRGHMCGGFLPIDSVRHSQRGVQRRLNGNICPESWYFPYPATLSLLATINKCTLLQWWNTPNTTLTSFLSAPSTTLWSLFPGEKKLLKTLSQILWYQSITYPLWDLIIDYRNDNGNDHPDWRMEDETISQQCYACGGIR